MEKIPKGCRQVACAITEKNYESLCSYVAHGFRQKLLSMVISELCQKLEDKDARATIMAKVLTENAGIGDIALEDLLGEIEKERDHGSERT